MVLSTKLSAARTSVSLPPKSCFSRCFDTTWANERRHRQREVEMRKDEKLMQLETAKQAEKEIEYGEGSNIGWPDQIPVVKEKTLKTCWCEARPDAGRLPDK